MKTPSKLRVHRVLAILAALVTTHAQAIFDTNRNGMSDLWEKQYNNGNLFPNTFLITNDDDKDGWSNAKEAIAGTNPFVANPPDGIVAVTVTPSLVNGAFTLSWPTLVGKSYQLEASTNLIAWFNLGASVVGITNTHTIGVDTTQPNNSIPPQVFWRITVSDLDSDLDGLTNSEELHLGTNPFNPDTDGDGIPDSIEIEIGTDPIIPDSDNNGIPDGEEDADSDGIRNRDDADPADNIVNWHKTGRPTFAVIEIPADDTENLSYVDHSAKGTILLVRPNSNGPGTAVIIDKNQTLQEIPYNMTDDTGISITQLIDDLIPAYNNTDTSDDSLYDPLTNTYQPWLVPTVYFDDIMDARDSVVVGNNWILPVGGDFLMRHSPNGDALPGESEQSMSAMAYIDRDGNIASDKRYWTKNPEGEYEVKTLPEEEESATIEVACATLKQTIGSNEKKWALLARHGLDEGLLISEDGENFRVATQRFGGIKLRALTRQGWIFDDEFRVWTGQRWETLLDILGQNYSEAELLGINDEGLAVAKIKKPNQPMKIGLLVPVEIRWNIPLEKWENVGGHEESSNGEPSIIITTPEPWNDPDKIDELGLKLRCFSDRHLPNGTPENVNLMSYTETVYKTIGGELLVSFNYALMNQFGIIPDDETDTFPEYSYCDTATPESVGSNLADSHAFAAGISMGAPTENGKAEGNGSIYNLVGKANKDFMRHAGVDFLKFSFGRAETEKRQVRNQVEWLYYSGHGHHDTGELALLDGNFAASDAFWHKELEAVILAGCSVLDIKDYRAQSFGILTYAKWLAKGGDSSPGAKWEATGPNYLLGYAWAAPLDTQGADAVAAAFTAGLNSGKHVITAWRDANDSGLARNACLIDAGSSPPVYYYWDEQSGTPVWTSVTKGGGGW